MSRTLWIILGLLALVLLWLWSSYNGLVTARGQVGIAWSQVQTDEQRRFDLVPNLQRVVEGSASFEASTLKDIVAARTQWQSAASAGDRESQVAAAQSFESSLSRLLVTVEAYPQLSSTQAFRDFMVQLEGTENRIATARRDYNQAVGAYNIRLMSFPTNLVAGMFGFTPEKAFEETPGANVAPTVEFNFGASASAS